MMNKNKFLPIALILISIKIFPQQNLKLWYLQPAKTWTEALPIGNGKIGAMVFGGIAIEKIQFNETTLWSGGPVGKNINPSSPQYLPLIRKALLEEKDYEKARELTKKMQGVFSESYLPLGDLIINQTLKDTQITSYSRELNISKAINITRFKNKSTTFTREIFASNPQNIIAIRISCDKGKEINFKISTRSLLRFKNFSSAPNEIIMKGKAPAKVDPDYLAGKNPVIYDDPENCKGMRWEMRIRASSKDGTIKADTNGLYINSASEVILYITAATSFNGYDKCPDKEGIDEDKLASETMERAWKKPFKEIYKNHIKDYQNYFNRVSFSLANSETLESTPTNERLANYSKGNIDQGLESLYFQFGRYLFICCSRNGSQASNLQGIWNKELRAPWSSNYTVNINTEMNYWPAGPANLSELNQPLFDLIKKISETGAVTSKEFYNTRGWVAHHNSDLWALTNPVGNRGNGEPAWANWPMAGNWLCLHLWEHYLFTDDKKFLHETAYPIMKGAANFCLDWFIEDKNGFLVTAPSTSPENIFKYGENKKSDVSVASTMDISIIRNLFLNTITASIELGIDSSYRNVLNEKTKKLYPFKIGKKGNLQEWYLDFEDYEINHRHVSHLFALHPANQISPLKNVALSNAAKKTLEIRGDEGTGWSKAWKINFWTRLLDGNHAYSLLRQLLQATEDRKTNYAQGGGTYPNLFDAHPPFQIDGNFGGTAGMTEMLLQSHLNEIHLLPGLPDAWKEGEINGICARGGFEININWKNNRLNTAEIKSLSGKNCKVRTSEKIKIEGATFETLQEGKYYITTFKTLKGKIYTIKTQ